MAARPKRRFWRLCRIYFRRFRITVWMLVLTVLAALIYVNQIGLPDVVKRPLLEKLRARGLDLQFSRLRLSWSQGIVAENVHFGSATPQFSPRLRLAEVRVRLNWEALVHLRLQIDSLALRQGQVVWRLPGPDPAKQLAADQIQTDLRFLPGDQWSLDNFKARFAGVNLELSGVVTNASAVRDWKVFHGEQPASRSARLWQDRLRSLADALEQIHFSSAPELRFNVRGDALDFHTFNVLVSVSAPGAQTPWGAVTDGHFTARLFSVDTNGASRAELDLQAQDAQTQWASITNFSLKLQLASVEPATNVVNGQLTLSAAQVQTQWAHGSNALITATWNHSLTNPIPISGQAQVNCDFAQTSFASATNVEVRGTLLPPSSDPTIAADPSWGWWTNLAPYRLQWNCQLSDLKSAYGMADRIACGGEWQPPRLAITNVDAALFDGQVAAQGELDVATRALHLRIRSDVDPHQLSPYLSEPAQNWLKQISWPSAPKITGEGSLILPPWTNAPTDWVAQIKPTLSLRGEVSLEQGASYRQMQVAWAHSHLSYSNQWWRLPDLVVRRPEGQFTAQLAVSDLSQDFYGRLSSTLNPKSLEPLLGDEARRGLALLGFSRPPRLEAEVWGRGLQPDRIGARGHLLVSNFTFRGEAITRLDTQLEYTNRSLRCLKPRVDTGARYAQADALRVDLAAQRIYLTNGFSTVDPMLVARVIGPHIVRAIEAYRFDSPPTARIHGTIPFHGEENANLHFDLAGGPFHWWKFNIPHITGHVHWAGLHLSLTNVEAEFYGGLAAAWAAFDFPPTPGTDFQFALSTTNVLLQSLMADLSTTTTNPPEGRMHGELTVTKANSESWQTVFGYGEAHLRDGLLWDIPLFGIFSPVLNGIAPGLGNSRASAAGGSFIITNGVIRTSDLEIRSTAMRLQYRGTVNLESQISARVDAELLRDMWLVGPLVSTVFWPVTKLFEYRVTGTLGDPRSQPVFIIPKIMLMPFHPFRTLKGLRQQDPNSDPNFSPLPP